MPFTEIKGQDAAIDFFRRAFNKSKLAHAYLFAGPQGLGKTLLAKNLAKFLNCRQPLKIAGSYVDCCDDCSSCHKADNFNHPDVHWVASGRQSKKISIDEIRSSIKDIALKPYAGKFKIFIVQDADNLTAQAANALLKSLEEPPPFCVIILIATNMSRLLPTIISRCQVIKFGPLNHKILKEILTTDYKLPVAEAQFLAGASEGRIGLALALKEQDCLNKRNRILNDVINFNRRASVSEVFCLRDKEELTRQIKYLLHWFRDIFIIKAGASESFLTHADRIDEIKSRARLCNFQELERTLTVIIEAHRLIEQNVNPKIALEVMLIEILDIKDVKYPIRTYKLRR